MWARLVLTFCIVTKLTLATDDEGIVYDKYTAEPVTDEMLALFESKGITGKCTMRVKPCDESEGRRTDGSCNNVRYPSMGTFLVPQERLLEANYPNGSYAKLSTTGHSLPLPRQVRTGTLTVGKTVSTALTQAVPTFGIFSFGDVGSTHDITFFLINKTDCCQPEHMNDEMCTPNIIPEDDPVHRFSGIRCLNMTKPLDHQYIGCTNDSTPSPISEATGILDLSQIYNHVNLGESVLRSYEGGKMITETDANGTVWPPSGGIGCIGNQGPDETKCFANHGGALLGISLLTVLAVRNHNYYATELAKVNPCWDDDKIFSKAKKLNIDTFLKILYEEWLSAVLGEQFLLEKGFTKESIRKDHYDESKPPKVLLEFIYIMRYFHILQESIAYKYDTKGNIIGNVSQTTVFARAGFLGKDNNFAGYTPSLYRQEAAAGLHQVDPDIADFPFPPHLQRSGDLPTSDLHKGRTMGMAPYVDYVFYYTGHKIKTWKNLKKFMSVESISLLKRLYKDVRDIDIMAGAWMEYKIEGGHVPLLVANIIFDYLVRNMITDRFFYARPNGPDALNDSQFEQLRNVNLASVICRNGDGITEIQRNAFLQISETNPLVDCSKIPTMDFSHFAVCKYDFTRGSKPGSRNSKIPVYQPKSSIFNYLF